MKHNLYLLRHAKSSWRDLTCDDFDRPLKKKGIKDSKLLGDSLCSKKLDISCIISSSAARAKQTAEIIYDKIQLNNKIIFCKQIYDSNIFNLLEFVRNINEDIMNVILVGHNPALTELNNYLSGHIIENIPTCGIVGLEFTNTWKDLSENCCKLILFEFPKIL